MLMSLDRRKMSEVSFDTGQKQLAGRFHTPAEHLFGEQSTQFNAASFKLTNKQNGLTGQFAPFIIIIELRA